MSTVVSFFCWHIMNSEASCSRRWHGGMYRCRARWPDVTTFLSTWFLSRLEGLTKIMDVCKSVARSALAMLKSSQVLQKWNFFPTNAKCTIVVVSGREDTCPERMIGVLGDGNRTGIRCHSRRKINLWTNSARARVSYSMNVWRLVAVIIFVTS